MFLQKDRYTMDDLLQIMKILRGENGCPWDREQNHQSIRKNFLEETYEVLEAIDSNDSDLLREELGDVLLQVVFHSAIEEEQGGFGFDDVCHHICQKLIVRHPHIFSDGTAKTAEEVLVTWDAVKKKQKGQKTITESLNSVPRVLPALMRSEKVQHRAAKAGFDSVGREGAFQCLASEWEELQEAVRQEDAAACEEELGDLLFSAVNISRFLSVDPEHCLTKACDKFIARFEAVEKLAEQRGISLETVSPSQLDSLWEEVKR